VIDSKNVLHDCPLLIYANKQGAGDHYGGIGSIIHRGSIIDLGNTFGSNGSTKIQK